MGNSEIGLLAQIHWKHITRNILMKRFFWITAFKLFLHFLLGSIPSLSSLVETSDREVIHNLFNLLEIILNPIKFLPESIILEVEEPGKIPT